MHFLWWAGTFDTFRAWPDRRHPLKEVGTQGLVVNQMNCVNPQEGLRLQGFGNVEDQLLNDWVSLQLLAQIQERNSEKKKDFYKNREEWSSEFIRKC